MIWFIVVTLSVSVGFVLGMTWAAFFHQSDEYDEIERRMTEMEDDL